MLSTDDHGHAGDHAAGASYLWPIAWLCCAVNVIAAAGGDASAPIGGNRQQKLWPQVGMASALPASSSDTHAAPIKPAAAAGAVDVAGVAAVAAVAVGDALPVREVPNPPSAEALAAHKDGLIRLGFCPVVLRAVVLANNLTDSFAVVQDGAVTHVWRPGGRYMQQGKEVQVVRVLARELVLKRGEAVVRCALSNR